MARTALTTTDNPYDPFLEFDRWYHFDTSKGYNTSSKLARVLSYSDELAPSDQQRSIEEAVEFLLELNPSGNLVKLTRDGDN